MRALRTLILGIALIMVLASCEMTVRFATTLEADGAGRFAVGVLLDRDARKQIDLFAERFGSAGFDSVEALFKGLQRAGWDVARNEPAGGLALEATTRFSSADDFTRVLSELRTAREAEDPGLGPSAFSLDVGAEKTFLRSSTSFAGAFDTTIPDPSKQQQALIEFVRRVLRIEVRAEFPTTAGEVRGPASSDGAVVVWTPAYGTSMVFGAEASSIRLGSLLLLLTPALVLLGGLGWILIGRRGRRLARSERPSAIEWEPAKANGVVIAPAVIDVQDPVVGSGTAGTVRSTEEEPEPVEPPLG